MSESVENPTGSERDSRRIFEVAALALSVATAVWSGYTYIRGEQNSNNLALETQRREIAFKQAELDRKLAQEKESGERGAALEREKQLREQAFAGLEGRRNRDSERDLSMARIAADTRNQLRALSAGQAQSEVQQRDERIREFQKAYYDKQFNTFREVIDTASILSTSQDTAQLIKALNDFHRLFYGEMLLHEKHDVVGAMIRLHDLLLRSGRPLVGARALVPEIKPTTDFQKQQTDVDTLKKNQQAIQRAALDLANACRREIAEFWQVRDLKDLPIAPAGKVAGRQAAKSGPEAGIPR